MTLALFLDICSWVLFVVGGAGVITGAIGVVRFPDFYSRLHAAGVTDTAGAELILFGMLIQLFRMDMDAALTGPLLVYVAKIVFIGFFLFLTSPVSTHAIAHSAWVGGLKPLVGKELEREEEN